MTTIRNTKGSENSNAAAIYCRVSTEEQAAEGVSLDAQENALRAYCALRRLDVAAVVVDGAVSGGKPLHTRPGGRRVLDLVERGTVGSVVAYKLDRLFRDACDCLAVTAEWDRRAVALHLVDLGGQAIDTSTAMGRFMLTVIAGAAEMERNQIRERTAAAMAHKRTLGEYTGGAAPYGWTVAADGIHLAADDAEQAIISAALGLKAAGLSLRKVGAELEGRGLLPRSGGHWHANTVRSLLAAAVAA